MRRQPSRRVHVLKRVLLIAGSIRGLTQNAQRPRIERVAWERRRGFFANRGEIDRLILAKRLECRITFAEFDEPGAARAGALACSDGAAGVCPAALVPESVAPVDGCCRP